MKITKKILGITMSVLCAASVVAGGSSFSVAEAMRLSAEQTDGNLTYCKVDVESDGTYDYVMITGCVDGATNVSIPATEEGLSVRAIENYAFSDSTELYDITVSSDNNYFSADNGVLFSKDKTTLLCYPQGKKATSYTIPSGVVTIGIGAFYNCENLTDITISNNVTSILMDAFNNCSGLGSIVIPRTVSSVGARAFEGTELLNNQVINKTGPLYYADTWVVDCDTDVTSIIDESTPIKAGTRGIADYTFYGCADLAKVSIPDSVVNIGSYAFADCSELATISIPSSVTSIGNYAFSSCSALTELTVPNSVKSIGDGVFANCTKLTTIQLSNSITAVEYRAFYNCSSLVSIDVPSSVTYIGEEAFYGCSGLDRITINNANCEIYDHSNTISNTATIYGYSGSTAETYTKNYNRYFSEISGQSGVLGDANEDGVLNVRDAAFIARKLAEQKVNELPSCADYNNDGDINVRDAAAIARHLASVTQ